jgi:hypothetical protein
MQKQKNKIFKLKCNKNKKLTPKLCEKEIDQTPKL